MESTNWENDIRQTAKKGRITPSEDRWDQIRRRMGQRRNRRKHMLRISWLIAAAGFALLIFFTAWYVIPGMQQDTMRSSSWEQLPESSKDPAVVPRLVYANLESGSKEQWFRLYRPDSTPEPR